MIKNINDLSNDELNALEQYLNNKGEILPYHSLDFINLMDEFMGYMNYSMVSIDEMTGAVTGYLPQWLKGKQLESVPWRDKGGPIFDNKNILREFVENTKEIVNNHHNIDGFIWRDIIVPELERLEYYVNVDIDLTNMSVNEYWMGLPSKVRGKVRQAKKHGLLFKVAEHNDKNSIDMFYSLFISNRRRLGVPVYPLNLFILYFKYFDCENIKLFEVYDHNNNAVAAMILLIRNDRAIDAYSASDSSALSLKANDFLLNNVIEYCIVNKIQKFDFGADSPLQENLIKYKLKWQGVERTISSSYYGDNVKEMDHNIKKYDFVKRIISNCPLFMYKIISSLLVR